MVYKRIILSICLVVPLHAMHDSVVKPKISRTSQFKTKVEKLNFYQWLVLTAGSTFIIGSVIQAFYGGYTRLFSKPTDLVKGTYKSLNAKIKFSAYGKANKKKIEEAVINTLDRDMGNYDVTWTRSDWEVANNEKKREDFINLKPAELQVRYYIKLIEILFEIVDKSNDARLRQQTQRERDDLANIKDIPEILQILYTPGITIPLVPLSSKNPTPAS